MTPDRELLVRLLGRDWTTQQVEASYVEAATALTESVTARSELIDAFGVRPIKDVIAESGLDIPPAAAKRWESIQKGRNFWAMSKEKP